MSDRDALGEYREVYVHARWHRALDDPIREAGNPIGDHIAQTIADAEVRGAARALAMVEAWFSDIDLDDLRAALTAGDPA